MKTFRLGWHIAPALLILIGLSARPAPSLPPTSQTPLIITAPAGLTRDAPGTYQTDLGTLDPLRVATVERTFTVRNTGPQPVTVADVRGSCGCETLLLTHKGTQAKSLTLAPGDEANVHLSIRLNTYADGPVRKYVYAYGPADTGQGTPLLTIALDMRLEKSIAFDPPSVDFGTVTAGQSASRPLLVTVALDLVAGEDLPTPASLNPDVVVRPLGATLRVMEDGKPALRRLFMLTLSAQAPAGRIAGDVRFEFERPPVRARPAHPDGVTAGHRQQFPVRRAVHRLLRQLPPRNGPDPVGGPHPPDGQHRPPNHVCRPALGNHIAGPRRKYLQPPPLNHHAPQRRPPRRHPGKCHHQRQRQSRTQNPCCRRVDKLKQLLPFPPTAQSQVLLEKPAPKRCACLSVTWDGGDSPTSHAAPRRRPCAEERFRSKEGHSPC